MKRYFFIGDSLDDLENVGKELEESGLVRSQIHVLSNDEAGMTAHELNPVTDFMKTNVVNSGVKGLVIGAVGAALVLLITAITGWAEVVGWVPFLFFAVVVLGFCTWEGGFLGFQEKNRRFRAFEESIRNHRHVLFVDVGRKQEELLSRISARYPRLAPAGDGTPAPGWIISGEQGLRDFARWGP